MRETVLSNARVLRDTALRPSLFELLPESERIRVEFLCRDRELDQWTLQDGLYVVAAIQRAWLAQYD